MTLPCEVRSVDSAPQNVKESFHIFLPNQWVCKPEFCATKARTVAMNHNQMGNESLSNTEIEAPLRLYALARTLGKTSKEVLAASQLLDMSYTSAHNNVSIHDARVLAVYFQAEFVVVDAWESVHAAKAAETTTAGSSDEVGAVTTATKVLSQPEEASVVPFANSFLTAMLSVLDLKGDVVAEGDKLKVVSQDWFEMQPAKHMSLPLSEAVEHILGVASHRFSDGENLRISWENPASGVSLEMEDEAIHQMAQLACRFNKAVTLFSLTSAKRRWIHQLIADNPSWGVQTITEGEGLFRRLHILPNGREVEIQTRPERRPDRRRRRPRPARRDRSQREQRNEEQSKPQESKPQTSEPKLRPSESKSQVSEPTSQSPERQPLDSVERREREKQKQAIASQKVSTSASEVSPKLQPSQKELEQAQDVAVLGATIKPDASVVSESSWSKPAVFGMGVVVGAFVTLVGLVILALLGV